MIFSKFANLPPHDISHWCVGVLVQDCWGRVRSTGIVLDFVRRMNHIVEIGDDYVIVEPGITKYRLDREFRNVEGLFLQIQRVVIIARWVE